MKAAGRNLMNCDSKQHRGWLFIARLIFKRLISSSRIFFRVRSLRKLPVQATPGPIIYRLFHSQISSGLGDSFQLLLVV